MRENLIVQSLAPATILIGSRRPLGFLAAWLRKGEDLPSQEDRWSAENCPTFQEMPAARDALKLLARMLGACL